MISERVGTVTNVVAKSATQISKFVLFRLREESAIYIFFKSYSSDMQTDSSICHVLSVTFRGNRHKRYRFPISYVAVLRRNLLKIYISCL